MSSSADPNLLVGFNLADDAGVYRISDELALVQTVDVFTPVVDDPFSYGQIAAANALSDVYAMGGRPLTALNIAAFPRQSLGFEVLRDILQGGLSKIEESGATLLGGHTVENAEPLYGLAVTGVVHPGAVATNAGARPGDVLILTKPLGTGIVATAIKREACPETAEAAAVASMATLNRAACDSMVAVGIGEAVHACTDVTGFGLIGHAFEMAQASGMHLQMKASRIPVLPGVALLAENSDFVSGGGIRNQQHLEGTLSGFTDLPVATRNILSDPQTSGGLLMAVAASRAADLRKELEQRGAGAFEIGEVVQGAAGITFLE